MNFYNILRIRLQSIKSSNIPSKRLIATLLFVDIYLASIMNHRINFIGDPNVLANFLPILSQLK